MKIFKLLLMAVVLVVVQAYAFSASASLGYMRISLIENDVQIKTPEADEWGFASVNTPLDEGDEVWVPQGGRAELQLNSGSYIRLAGNTALQVLSIDEDSSQFYLTQGNAYIFYDAPRGSVIQIDTPDASTRAFDRAIFGVSMSDQYTDVAVYKGYVETENQIGETRVNAGEMISLGPNTDGEIGPIGSPHDWEWWNQARNERLLEAKKSESSRYLPSELRTYSSDMDSSGRWVHVPEYGNVWSPRGFVSVNWTPYREGRWIWRGGDYVWVSYEPWGWVPYHYGRWSFSPSIGWFWVPPVRGAVYWAPGYVGWVRTDNYVGWVPLAPGEIYYGRGYFGRHSVNITKVNINHIHVTNVYKNVTINNGPIIVDRHSFHKGRPNMAHVDKKDIHDKIFIPKNMRHGSPHDIKPEKANYFASDREVTEDKLPPQPVRQQKVKELKKSRRMVREADKSVLNPGAEPKALPMKKVDTPRTPGKGKPRLEKMQPERQGEPTASEGGRKEKKEQQQFQQEQEGKRTGTEGGRRTKEKGKQQPVQQEQPELQPQPAAPAENREEKKELQQLQPDQQSKPAGPEGGRKTRDKVKKQPAQQQDQPELQMQPAGPEESREEKKELQQLQPDQQGKPAGPEGGRKTRDKVKKQPAQQQDQPELQMQPAGPEGGREIQRDRKQVQQDQQLPLAVPDEGRRTKDKVKKQPVQQQDQPELQMQPAGRESSREIRKERQVQPEPRIQPVVPDEGRRTREKIKQQPVQQQDQPELQMQPAGRENSREIRKERQVQPEPRMQPVVPDEGRRRKDKAKQPQAEAQCGPGQKDANNPEICPQNFPRRR